MSIFLIIFLAGALFYAIVGGLSLLVGGVAFLQSRRFLREFNEPLDRGESQPGKYWDQSEVEDFLEVEEF